jgi:O-6-methylguanine DNA methyltransferase
MQRHPPSASRHCPAALQLLASPAALALRPFTLAVLRECAAIPRGRVATYGALAAAVGRPGAAQAVGNALHANPFAPAVPCHRVLPASLRLGGFEGQREGSCSASSAKKRALLAAEGVRFDAQGRLEGGAALLHAWPGGSGGGGGGGGGSSSSGGSKPAAVAEPAGPGTAPGSKRRRGAL